MKIYLLIFTQSPSLGEFGKAYFLNNSATLSQFTTLKNAEI